MIKSRIAKTVMEKLDIALSDEYSIKYNEKLWGKLYTCEITILRENIPIAWITWMENEKRKLPKYEWILLIPNERVINVVTTWEEIKKIALIVNEINDLMDVWNPKSSVKEGGK